jgi:hypothetical protein
MGAFGCNAPACEGESRADRVSDHLSQLLCSTSPNAKVTRIDKVLAALLHLALTRVESMRQVIYTDRFA